MKGKVAEVFASVQGEGIYLAERQLFVRFFDCNLRCRFCDTPLTAFKEYEPEELFSELKSYENGIHSISFTGGEPLLQQDFLKEILKLSHDHGFKNYLETNGTLPEALEEVIDDIDIVAMDLKLPSSTGLGHFWGRHRKFLQIASQKEVFLKTVICQTTQERDLKEALNLIKGINAYAILVLQPNSYEDYNKIEKKLESFRDICIEDGITTCIIPQIHKITRLK